MSFLGTRVVRHAPVIDIDLLGLDADSQAWLASRLGTTQPKLEAIDSLQQSALTDGERIFLTRLNAAIRGSGRNVTTTVSSAGAAEAAGVGLVEVRLNPLMHEADAVRGVREAMANGLWGHEQHLDAFLRLASDFTSRARTLAPIMALGGDRGHGKDQAVTTLARGLFGEKGKVVTVDFAGLTDAAAAKIFEESGALAPASLKSCVGSAVIRLANSEGLMQRAPALARRLVALLSIERDAPEFRNVPFVIDLTPASGRSTLEELVEALGPGSASLASAKATFGPLDEATAQRYGLARLTTLLRERSFKNVGVDFDEAALDVLAKVLGTPHAPLDDMDLRLYRLVLSHLERVAVGGELEAFQLTAALPEEQAAPLIANLRSSVPALEDAEKLLRLEPIVFGSTLGKSAASVVVDAPAIAEGAVTRQAAVVDEAAAVDEDTKPVRAAPPPRMPHSPATVQPLPVAQVLAVANDPNLFTAGGAASLAVLERALDISAPESVRNQAADELVINAGSLSANAAILLLNRTGVERGSEVFKWPADLTPALAGELGNLKPGTRACARAILTLRKVQCATERDKQVLWARAKEFVFMEHDYIESSRESPEVCAAFEEALAKIPLAPAGAADADRFFLQREGAVVAKRDVAARAFIEATNSWVRAERWRESARAFVDNVDSMSPRAVQALFDALPANVDARPVLFEALPKISCANNAEREAMRQFARRIIKRSAPVEPDASLQPLYAKAAELIATGAPQTPPEPAPSPAHDVVPPVDRALADEILALLGSTTSTEPDAYAPLFVAGQGTAPFLAERLRMAMSGPEPDRYSAAIDFLVEAGGCDARAVIAILQNMEVGIDRSYGSRWPSAQLWLNGQAPSYDHVHGRDVALAFSLLKKLRSASEEQRATLRQLVTRVFTHSCSIDPTPICEGQPLRPPFPREAYPAALDVEISELEKRTERTAREASPEGQRAHEKQRKEDERRTQEMMRSRRRGISRWFG